MSEVERLLADQVQYYERRADEYDRTSTPALDSLAPQGDRLRDALRAFEPRGRVLEIACGTGSWTLQLLPFADHITAVDASPRMLQLHEEKVRSPKVTRILTDVFSWEPDQAHDVVFFAFWLSHVPPAAFVDFWDLVRRSLARGGRVFFVDEGPGSPWHEEDYLDPEAASVRRTLEDGTEHRAVKVFWGADDLADRLGALGWDAEVHETGAFYWGAATLADG